jgi:hypothetical protein
MLRRCANDVPWLLGDENQLMLEFEWLNMKAMLSDSRAIRSPPL